MANQNKLFDLLKENDFGVVIAHLQAQKSDLKETFEIFTKAQSVTFWNVILSHMRSLMPVVSELCDSLDSSSDKALDDKLSVMKCVLSSVSGYCLVSKFKPPAIFDIILLAQNVLMCNKNLATLSAVKILVSKLSELWWLNNEEGAENLMPQLVTYLLMSTLGIDGHDVDIKRLFALRGAFHLMDFEDSSSSFIRELIQRTFVHPSFLRVKEGQKLLSFFLNVNHGLLVNVVTAVIKPQLASGAKSVAATYGRIFYQAWSESQALKDEEDTPNNDVSVDASAQVLEDMVQNFLREGIHASEDKYFRGVRCLLQAFHDAPRSKLDAMLLRVYDPILWRSLRCANAQVRAQAAVVFLDVFPLQHADGRAEDNDKILQKQFDLLAALLTDSDQRVRAHAALGVCHILKEYWESLPLNTTHNILKFLIDTLSVDASCANVRHAVFVGLGELFHQPLTHTLLKQLLPLLRNSIHDKSEKVRVAFMKILCQVKGIRGMHFYDIVPVDHLLVRMAADRNCTAVCLVMTELLLNSFYPQSESAGITSPETEQLNRCIQFIAKDPVAAEVFYSHLHRFISIGQVAKLVTVLFTFLVTADARDRAGHVEEETDTNNSAAAGKRRRAVKNSLVHLGFAEKLGLMRLVVKLLESVTDQLPTQHLSRELIAKYFTEEHARSLLTSSAICDPTQAVHLLPVSVQLVALSVTIRKMTAPGDKNTRRPVSFSFPDMIFHCFVPVWTHAEVLESDVAEMARSALAKAFVEVCVSAEQETALLEAVLSACEVGCQVNAKLPGRKATSKARPIMEEAVQLPFGAAVDLLVAFGASHCCGPQVSKTMAAIVDVIRSKVESVLCGGSDDSLNVLLLRALQVWVSTSLHEDVQAALQQEKDVSGHSLFPNIMELMKWSSTQLVSRLCVSTQCPFACRVLGMVLAMLSDLFYLDMHDESICLTLRGWLCDMRGKGSKCPAAFSRDTTLLLPALIRIATLLRLGKDSVVCYISELSVAVVDVMLLRIDCAVADEKEGAAVLNLFDSVASADSTVESCLVRLIDEIDSQGDVEANDFHDIHLSASGAFIRTALVDNTDNSERVDRVYRVLHSWQAMVSTSPFSIKNALVRVSSVAVLRLLQEIKSVHPSIVQRWSSAKTSSAVENTKSVFADENQEQPRNVVV